MTLHTTKIDTSATLTFESPEYVVRGLKQRFRVTGLEEVKQAVKGARYKIERELLYAAIFGFCAKRTTNKDWYIRAIRSDEGERPDFELVDYDQ